MRRFILLTSALLFSVPVHAQTSAQQTAYTLTVTCSVVAAYYKNPDDIQRTADALRRMAAVMGYDNARTSQDVTGVASEFGVEIRDDPSLMERHRSICRRARLIS